MANVIRLEKLEGARKGALTRCESWFCVKRFAVALVVAAIGWTVSADQRRPMAIHFMLDGLRADAVESGQMPNLAKLRAGAWQPGYAAAWTLFARTVPESTVSAPNHVSIATGVTVAKHGVKDNGQTVSGNFSAYPTWLARVVGANPSRHALFAYSWAEDGDLGATPGVTFLHGTDAENAVTVPARLAASDAPDATMLFIDCPDAGGHAGGYYPYSSDYLTNVRTADATIGACLAAIVSRATFADEDWLVVVVADHGGFSTSHSNAHAAQASTVPIVVAGQNVAPGEIRGRPYNYDPTANLLAHFGLGTAQAPVDARAVAGTSATERLLASALAVYLPFNDATMANLAPNATVTAVPTASNATVVDNGFAGKGLKIAAGGTVKLEGSQSLEFEDGGQSFTVTVWVRQNQSSFSSDPVIWGNKNWASGGNAGLAFVANGGRAGIAGLNGPFFNYVGSARYDIGNFITEGTTLWAFYAVTRTDDGVVKVYQGRRDGALCWVSEDGAAMTTSATGYPFYLGSDGTGAYGNSNAAKRYVGELDDFAMWTRGLSHDEIRRIYENGRRGLEFGELLAAETLDRPTLAVTNYDGDTATLAFGGTRTVPYTLCVASGAADAGDDKHAWDHFDTVSEIAAETTTHAFTLPAEFKSEQRKFRFFLLKTTDLPYTSEVATLASAGASAVNTQVYPRSGTSIEFDVVSTAANKTCDWIFGAYYNAGSTSSPQKPGNFGLALSQYPPNLLFHHEISGGNAKHSALFAYGQPNHVLFSVPSLTIDGVTEPTGQSAAGFVEHGYPIELFRNLRNNAAYDSTINGTLSAVMLRADGVTVRDLVPVVDADGKGAYFDQVSGRLIPETTGNALTAGAARDAARKGWVRADTETLDGNASRLATAWWTGRGAAGDFSDPENWACTNAVGIGVDGAVPTAETTVYMGGETTFAVPEGTTLFPHAGGIVFVNARLAADCDWHGLALGDIAAGSTIDLNGHVLQFAGTAAGTPNGFTVADTSAGESGVFRVSVAEGVTFTNSTINLTGNLRLVKDGAGTLLAKMPAQTYEGGTEIVAGTVACGATIDQGRLFGATGSEITVRTGASFNLLGKKGGEAYPFVLDGGTVMNDTPVDSNDATIGSLRLLADSTLLLPDIAFKHDVTVAQNSVWDLGGKTLTVKLLGSDPDLCFKTSPVTIRNGTVKTVGTEGFFHDYIGVNASDRVTYDFESKLRLKASGARVANFINRTTSNGVASRTDSKVAVWLELSGTFTPLSPWCFNMRLFDGATVDLRARETAWSLVCAVNYGDNYTTRTDFAGGTVTVDLAGRTDLAQGVKVIDFAGATVSEGVVFVPDAATAENYMFERKSDGLYLAAFVKTARWTGETGDGNATNPANWDCRDANENVVADALPGLSTTVLVPTDATNFNFPADQSISVGEIRFLGDTYTLGADADWSGIGSGMVSRCPEIIDVNGHELTLSVEPLSTSNTTDLTTPGGNVRAYFGSDTTPHASSVNLVDNAPTSAGRILSPNPFAGCRIDYDFGAGQGRIVRGLRFHTSSYQERRPKDVTVYGTMADPGTAAEGDWTLLGTLQDLKLTVNGWSDYLHFNNETPYRAYRLKINSNMGKDTYGTYLELWEMELVESVPLAANITSSVAGGTLTFDVPSGKSVQIAKTSLSGLLKVRKTGAGTLVFSKENQTYADGTEVAGGTFLCGVSATATTPLGPWGNAITVNEGGTFDIGGVNGIENYALTLAGGTLQNSGADSATVGSLVLTADSKINFPNVGTGKNDIKVVSNTEWDLGGKMLTVMFAGTDPDLLFQNVTNVKIHNGTIKTTGNGFFNDQIGVDATDRVTYDFASKLRLKANAAVSNFICRTTYNDVASRKTDNKTDVWLTLSGTFTPLSPYCYNMRLVSGATIDLSTRDTAWPLECAVNYSGNYTTRTDFADGATIKVDLGERAFKEKTQIIAWKTPPANLSTLHFRSADRQYPLVADSTGVWALPKLFLILIR